MSAATAQRSNVVLHPDRTRVLLRPFLLPNDARARKICAQVMALPESEVHTLWEQVRAELEQVQVQAELEQAQAQVQAELEQVLAPAQLHDQTISDAPLLREIYDVGQKMAWHLAAPLLAQAA